MKSKTLILSLEDESEIINNDLQKIESMDNNIDDGMMALEELYEMSSIIQSAVDSRDGVSVESMKHTVISMSRINRNLGLQSVDKTVVSLESNMEEISNLKRANLALESISDKIKTVWEAIKDIFKWVAKMIAKVIDKVLSFFNSSDKICDSFEDRVTALTR